MGFRLKSLTRERFYLREQAEHFVYNTIASCSVQNDCMRLVRRFCAPKVPPRGREIDVCMYVRIVERNHQVDRRSQVQVSSLDKNSSMCLFFDKTPSTDFEISFSYTDKKKNLSIYGRWDQIKKFNFVA